MDKTNAIAEVERRAFNARKTMGEICSMADMHLATWSRAKGRGRISVGTITRVEQVLDRLEREREQ